MGNHTCDIFFFVCVNFFFNVVIAVCYLAPVRYVLVNTGKSMSALYCNVSSHIVTAAGYRVLGNRVSTAKTI